MATNIANARCDLEDFVGPKQGVVHVYEDYSGGSTKVWGLFQTSSDTWDTLVDTTLPSIALPDNDSSIGFQKKSYMIRKYLINNQQLILRKTDGDHVLLDLNKDEWEYFAKLSVGTKENVTTDEGHLPQPMKIICRVLTRKKSYFMGKSREIIQVSYKSLTAEKKELDLGRLNFVEGVGCLIGELPELSKIRPITDAEENTLRELVEFPSEKTE